MSKDTTMPLLQKKYKSSNSPTENKLRDQIVMDYAPLVRFVAYKLSSRLPANIETDDLISAGIIGLMDAINKYDPTRYNKFKTYAEFRIRGAMLDDLRAQDWIPRSIRDKTKQIEKAYAQLEQKLCRRVSEYEVSQELNLDINDYYILVKRMYNTQLVNVGDYSNTNYNYLENRDYLEKQQKDAPDSNLAFERTREALVQYVNSLPSNQKLVVCLYYFDELSLREIGKVMRITESRVSQLHTQALEIIKQKHGGTLKNG
jgi:RNA polymerase sigma factor FliA